MRVIGSSGTISGVETEAEEFLEHLIEESIWASTGGAVLVLKLITKSLFIKVC